MNRKQRRAAGQQAPAGAGVDTAFAAALGHHRAGQLALAERLYREVLAADPRHVQALHYLGVLACQTGQFAAALELFDAAIARDRRRPDTHVGRGAALQALGRLDAAAAEFRRAIALQPDLADAHLKLGNVLTAQDHLTEAAACYERVLSLDPNSAIAHYNLGNLDARAGCPSAARYRAALALAPDFAEAHNNLGNALRAEGAAGDAEAAYRRALALRPDYPDARNNLGLELSERDAFTEAVAQFREALRLRPDFAAARGNLAVALARANDIDAAMAAAGAGAQARQDLARRLHAGGATGTALRVLTAAMAQGGGEAETRALFARLLGTLAAADLDESWRGPMLRALHEGWGSASDLEHAAAQLIRRTKAVADGLTAIASQGEGARLTDDALDALAGDELLIALLISGRVCDRDLESVLTAARRSLLAGAADAALPPARLAFFAALARQCCINEYVFEDSAAETAAVDLLAADLASRLQSGAEISALAVLAVAAYRSLHGIAGAAALLERPWPQSIAAVLTQQLREPFEEAAIAATIPALTAIDDDVSRAVQSQYEENPYPRWIDPGPAGAPLGLDAYVATKFQRADYRARAASGPLDILVAGCGTGRHAITTRRAFAQSRVLAIDLSRRSLAYAIRKSRELGETAIDYAQADILQLGEIDRRFDVIESSGVLHHLADPFAGWRVLLALLKPGGVMTVGLYSRAARADISAARDLIAARGYRPTPADIRRCRQEIVQADENTPFKSVALSGDFYSLSGCRDLLFHVQEHLVTIPEIAGFLTANNLRLLGFELDARILAHYRERYPDDPAMTNLAHWHDFETAIPRAFAGMYQFAVQKAG